MKLIIIDSINMLPKVTLIEYRAPFKGEPVESVREEFKERYGRDPEAIYKFGSRYFVPKERISDEEI